MMYIGNYDAASGVVRNDALSENNHAPKSGCNNQSVRRRCELWGGSQLFSRADRLSLEERDALQAQRTFLQEMP